jgi:hypothetical protein
VRPYVKKPAGYWSLPLGNVTHSIGGKHPGGTGWTPHCGMAESRILNFFVDFDQGLA